MSYLYILYIARTTSYVRSTTRYRMLHVRHHIHDARTTSYIYILALLKNSTEAGNLLRGRHRIYVRHSRWQDGGVWAALTRRWYSLFLVQSVQRFRQNQRFNSSVETNLGLTGGRIPISQVTACARRTHAARVRVLGAPQRLQGGKRNPACTRSRQRGPRQERPFARARPSGAEAALCRVRVRGSGPSVCVLQPPAARAACERAIACRSPRASACRHMCCERDQKLVLRISAC
jgi:hypothetical protein